MKITINEVAQEAGVSKSTVSRVLSNNGRISKATKQKVNDVIKKLGYQPNITARNLAKNRTKTLGVVLPIDAGDYFGNPIYIQMMQGISLFAQENNYFIMYAFGKSKDEEQNINEFSNGGIVDGMIMLKTEVNDRKVEYLEKMKFPFVMRGRPNNSQKGLWVDNDNEKTMFDLVDELFTKNHKEIAFVGAKESWVVSKIRLAGYKRALKKHKVIYNKELVYHGEAFVEEVGYRAMQQLAHIETISAIVCTDDLIAVGVNRYLQEKNIKNKAIIGFNNTAIASYQSPTLSSVEIQGIRLGYEATKLLVDYLEGNVPMNYHKVVETKLIRRQSYR